MKQGQGTHSNSTLNCMHPKYLENLSINIESALPPNGLSSSKVDLTRFKSNGNSKSPLLYTINTIIHAISTISKFHKLLPLFHRLKQASNYIIIH
ncbi:MAG: hypothetical protein H7Y07_11720 [Pyrinomonadaceae bacterium]|nr:hypothetical protein [Sphingobacteriaceae bacterium]